MLLQGLGSIIVFPGQIFAKLQNVKDFQPEYNDLTLSFSEEISDQNRTLQTVKIVPENASGKIVIIFNGQNATFRNKKKLKTYCQLAEDTRHTIVGFDYGGTGLKKISTWDYCTIVADGLYLAQKCWEETTTSSRKANKIPALILKGNSLGGAIATKVAKLCHDRGIPAYLWNGRSFKSVSAVFAGQMQTLHLSGHYENRITRRLATILQPLLSSFFELLHFEIEVAKDYQAIPAGYKNYYIVRSTKKDRLHKKDDCIIPHCATLEADGIIKITSKKMGIRGQDAEPTEISYFTQRRKVSSKHQKNAHPTPENELFCRKDENVSVYELFCFFATKYVEKHSAEIFDNHPRSRSKL